MERHRPDAQADERTMLEQVLDFHRATLLLKTEGLTDAQLRQTTAASSLTLAGLLKHLALVEDHWFSVMLLGREPAEPWRGIDWDADPDWEFRTALEQPREELVALYTATCTASREAIASVTSLDDLSVRTRRHSGQHFNLRWVMLHMIEETARHNGHADLLREAIDGTTGE
jgi:uncharacterized damage-inducible protein DinB